METLSSDKKVSAATAARLKGNRFYKGKRWEKALDLYMTSLKARPYAVNTLANIAQVRVDRVPCDATWKRAQHLIGTPRRQKKLISAQTRSRVLSSSLPAHHNTNVVSRRRGPPTPAHSMLTGSEKQGPHLTAVFLGGARDTAMITMCFIVSTSNPKQQFLLVGANRHAFFCRPCSSWSVGWTPWSSAIEHFTWTANA